jgi:outer membrane protein
MRRRFLLLLVPAALQGQGVATGDARAVSLDEAIQLAQKNSPLAVQARGQVRTSEAAIRTQYGTFLPTLTLSYGSNRQGGETFFQGQLVPFRGDPWNFSRGLNSSLELFDAGRRLYNLRTAKANLTTAEANERLQMFRIALEVKQQYYNVQAGRESRAAAEAQLAQADEQLKAATARLAAGAATKSDSLRSIIQVGNARLAILTAENNIALASANLTRLVGTTFAVTAAGTEPLAPTEIDAGDVARWIEDAPSVASARSAVAAAGSAIRASRTSYWPSLSLGLNYNGSRTDAAFAPTGGPYAGSHAMRFTLSFPVFNGFQREENVTRASAAEIAAQADLRDAC